MIIDRRTSGWKQAHIAAAMGISRKCVRSWLARYEAEAVARGVEVPPCGPCGARGTA
ncbi:helix-turn-helix domain-containing protein [Modestobacter marinus]|uniref:helix-turn-helix domain-containing protein n=1 Tax=Modestobacter marinus TaxID=477641 RepID=UPI001C948165